MGPDRCIVHVEQVTGTATTTKYGVVPFTGSWKLVAACFMPDTTLATHSTDYFTLAVYAANGSDTVGSYTTASSGGAALTAGTARFFTLSGNVEYAGQTEEVKLVATAAAGTPTLHGKWVLAFEKFRAA